VIPATVALRRRGLLRQIQPAGSRVTKYEHLLREEMELGRRERAVLGVLILRGPPDGGRAVRAHHAAGAVRGPADLEEVLESLIAREPEPLATRLPRRSGQKEVRFAHLLSGEPPADATPDDPPAPTRRAAAEDDRVAALEKTVEELRAEVAELRAQLDAFRAQFQ
jgi:uncharacterized protein YceH (UPF0502 family)